MTENLAEQLVAWFQNSIPPEWIAFIISLLPILELRGGLIAARLLKIDWVWAFIICWIGNMLPVPFILLFFRKILKFLQRRPGLMKKFADWLERKTLKNRAKVERYQNIGLLLFVAIPLPGTGAWTGAMLASLLDMRMKRALPMITLGVLCAGVIMLGVSYVIPSFFV